MPVLEVVVAREELVVKVAEVVMVQLVDLEVIQRRPAMVVPVEMEETEVMEREEVEEVVEEMEVMVDMRAVLLSAIPTLLL
jgi:hypothetical protein